jgi:RNA ligase
MKHDCIEKRDRLVEEGVLRCDDLDDLRIYNYTNHCKQWDETTLNSRGIIFDRKTGKVVAQTFPKFFNMNERIDTQERNLPWHDGFRIFTKEDGWFGILYRHAGQHKIASRGSFSSPGALWATEFLKRYDLTNLPDEVTLLFEMICPITKIVVEYGDREDLVLLAAYNRRTGEEYDWEQVEKWSKQFGFTLVDSYNNTWLGHCRGLLKNVPGNEQEGFVIRFANGFRIKMKSEDYFRRHHLLSNLTPLVMWNNMVDGEVPKDVWDQVDVEYHDLLDDIVSVLEKQYMTLMHEIRQEFNDIYFSRLEKYHEVPRGPKDEMFQPQVSRRDFAIEANKGKHAPGVFALLDGHYHKVDRYVMKMIRPHGNEFFTGEMK